MTTIFADAKKGVMVCDSKASHDGAWFPCEKVYAIDGHLFGIAGAISEATDWLDWYRGGKRGKMPPIANVSILYLNSDGLYIIESSGRAVEVKRGFYGVGSGGMAAMGAFMAGADAKKAVEIATKIDAGSGGDVVVHKLKA